MGLESRPLASAHVGGYEYGTALSKGCVRTLQQACLEAIHYVLTPLRGGAEIGGDNNRLQEQLGLWRHRLQLRFTIILHEELTDLVGEWDELRAAPGPFLNPDHEKAQQRADDTAPPARS